MAPAGVDVPDNAADAFCPVEALAVGEGFTTMFVKRGIVFLKIVSSVLSLKPPFGEVTVAPPDGLAFVQHSQEALHQINSPSADDF